MSQKKLLMQGDYGDEQWLGLPLFTLDSYLELPRWARWTYYLEACLYNDLIELFESGRLKFDISPKKERIARLRAEMEEAWNRYVEAGEALADLVEGQ